MTKTFFFSLVVAVAITMAGGASATTIGDGGVALQGLFDQITQGGPSSVDVNTDQMSDSSDSYWQLTASGGSVNTIIMNMVLTVDDNVTGEFGVYDMKNPASMVSLFTNGQAAGTHAILGMRADGSVEVNAADTGIDFADNAFGYYLTVGELTFFSDTLLNNGEDRMLAYQGTGDTVQVPTRQSATWIPNEFIMAWETGPMLRNDFDGEAIAVAEPTDYVDFVVMAESIQPVPEPASLALLGLGLAGLAVRRSRKKC